MPVSAACDRRKLAARLAAAAAIVLLGAGTMMPGATGQAVSPPYPGTDLRQDCRYQRRGAQPLRVGNVAGVDDAATTVSGSFAAAAACLDYSDNNGAILDVFLPIIVGAAQILAAAAARRPELAGICTLPLAMWITMDSNAVAADVLRRIAPNGELCACAGGLTAAEKLQLVALLLPMECHIDDQGGLPAALLGCPHMHGTAVDLGLECSYATAERGATLLVMFHLATAGRLALHQCGSPTRLTMQLYADGRDQSGDGGDGAATAGDLAPASLPWQPRYGFADDVSRSTILACEGEPAAPLVLISEWLEAGPHALLVSRGRNGGTDALANASDYIVGIRAFDDERRLLASTALSVRSDTTSMVGLSDGDTEPFGRKWSSIVHSPVSGLLYAAPYGAVSVLIIDPATNTADTTTISGLSDGIYMWRDIVHSPVSGLLYAAPYNANSVLIIDPATNTADTTAVSGLGDGLQTWSTRTRKWSGIVHSPVSGLLYAAPSDADSVLVVYPNPNGTSPTETDRCALRSQCATTCRASGCGWNDTQGLCRTSEVPTHVSAVQRGAGRHDGESCPVFRLNSTCADEIQAQFDAFQESEYFVLGVRKTIPVPDWSGTACGGGLHQTFADTSMFLSPTDQDYSTIIRAREFKITRDDGTALARDMYALTDPTTYEAFVSNMVPGNYTGRWIATDGGMQGDEPYPQRTVVATLPFEVRDYTITLKEGCRSELDAMVHNLSTSIYYVGDFLGVEGLSPGCTIAGGGFDGVNDPSRATFQVRITNTNDGSELDGAKLIDSSTGQMLIQPRLASAGGEYTAELQVRDGARPAQTFANWTIAPRRHVDSDDVTNGPNGRGCVNGAPLDRIEFDLQYACDCSGTEFTGDNCDVSPASELATVLGAGLGAVLGLIMIVLVSTRVQLYRLKHRPIDMEAVQGDVLAGLGIGVAKDILDHEFGIMLELAADQGDNMIADISAYQAQLVSAVAEYVPRLAHEFKQARISPSEHGPQKLLLVIPKPVASHTLGSIKGSIKGTTATTDVPEWTVAVLTKEISRRGGLPFGPTGSVVFVSLAMPNHVPREMNRSCLTRLAPLGSGAFGEVFLYEVNEPKRGIPPYQVAAKTVKPGGSMGRDELLKEAALMSLLNHRNVMALVGVVTVPRNLPALVLMVYCEGGELLGYVKNSSPDRLSTTKLLTFVAQIALGMQHISGCSIVHRDVAARNVLLDTMGRCKVADFGMSASLVHADKQYASEYVRVQEEIALRWAAPEALHEQRFSVQSDVWSFGVTVWELFAAGAEPYGELGLAEVGPFVKAGGRLEQPAGSRCPGQVYAEVIIPCWAHDASERPSFGELYDAAIRNGGVEDQVALDERAKPVHTSDFLSGDLRYQAPSVHYLSTKLLSDLTTAVTPTVQANLDGRGDPKARFPLLDVGDASSYHIKDYIVVPLTRHIMCSRDQLEGAIFVDTLSGADDVGPATAILSYAWKYPFRLVSGAMDEWCRADGLDPSLQYVWIDVLCWNQHGRLSDPVSEWETRVGAIGHQLTMLHPWNNPVYVTRAWCIFELWHAIGLGAKCNLGIILAPEDRIAFHDAITKEGYGIVDAALEHIRAESAEAFSADDLANITAKVKSTPGGFDTLNEVVKGRLRQWFESQGGMKARDLTVGFGVLTPTSSPPNSMNHVYTPASNSGSNASADRSPAQAAPAAMQPLSANHSTFGFPAQPESPASPKPQSGFGFDVDNAYDEEEDLPPASDAPDAIRLATSYTTFTV